MKQWSRKRKNIFLAARIWYMVFLYNVGFKLIIFNKNKMSKLDEKRLVLIKFQPEEILFMHRDSRVIYRYFDLTQDVQEYPKIEH